MRLHLVFLAAFLGAVPQVVQGLRRLGRTLPHSRRTMNLRAVPAISFFMAGGLSCMVSHAAAVPLDVLKTRQQTSTGAISLRNLVNEEGLGVLAVGLSSTVAGYAVHGSLKFGFYEFFKTQLTDETQAPLVLLMSALAAEFIASVFLTPFEAARIRLVSDPEFADGLVGCWLRISAQEGSARLFYGFPAILAKHGPGTVLQLTTFEALSSALSETMESRTAIVLIAGLCSAVLATLASQPGDCLLTAINAKSIASLAPPTAAATSTTTISTAKGDTSVSVIDLMRDTIRELGLRGLFRGTKERLLHVAVIVVIQLSIYDSIKASLGIAVGH